MLSLRSILVFAATIALVVACEGQFQRPATQAISPSPLVAAILGGIDDPNLVAELKLSEDQVKKLVARRREVWDEKYQTAAKKFAENEAKRAEATKEAFKTILSAEQYKRTVQLAAQHVLLSDYRILNVPNKLTDVDAVTLENYPELVIVFQLTAKQKEELVVAAKNAAPANGFPNNKKSFPAMSLKGTIAVSPEQTTAVKEFLGPIFTKSWKNTVDPRDGLIERAPPNLRYIANTDVRDDMEMTKEQYEKFTTSKEKSSTPQARQAGETSPKETRELTRQQNEANEKLLAATLIPTQSIRLKQIVFQIGHPNHAIDYLYKIPQIATELGIGADQTKKLDGVWQKFHDDLAKAFDSDADFEGIEKRLKDLIEDRQKNARAILNADQAAKLLTFVGEPFMGTILPYADRQQVNDTPARALERAVAFGRYSMEFQFLAENKSVQRELRLTPRQIKQAVEVWGQLQSTYSRRIPNTTNEANNIAYAQKYEERSKVIETSLAQLLTAEQAKRFREIMLHYYKNSRESGPANQYGTIHPVSYPGVAEAVKLTEEQKKSLLVGTSPHEVLTFEQKKTIAKMLGEPITFELSLHGKTLSPQWLAPKRTAGPSFIRLITLSPSVSPENLPVGPLEMEPELIQLSAIKAASLNETLKLNAEQSRTFDAALEAYRITLLEKGRYGNMIEARATYAKATEGLLNAEQKTRLAQLIVQWNASRSLAGALAEFWTAKSLELRPEQITQVRTREQDSLHLCDTIVHLNDPDEKLLELLRDAIDNRLLSLLTEAQRARWKELTGEPWRGLQKRLPAEVKNP